MARLARIVVPDCPRHVTQRGNRRQRVFFGRRDYEAYLALLSDWTDRCGVRVWAYCLMPNHVHLIVVPSSPTGLARAVGQTHVAYTRRINFRKRWRGYLWQGRFASSPMDEPHLLAAAAYVERNPVKAGLADRAEDWPWSSAAIHLSGRPDRLAETAWLEDRIGRWVCSWGEYLRQADVTAPAGLLRRAETTGRPVGDATFVAKVGRLLKRDLTPKKPGRKPKTRSK